MDARKLRTYIERDEPLPEEGMTTIRLDFDEADISPLIIRGLLARFGRVGEVSVYSGRISNEDYCYALVDLPDRDAIDFLKRSDTGSVGGEREWIKLSLVKVPDDLGHPITAANLRRGRTMTSSRNGNEPE